MDTLDGGAAARVLNVPYWTLYAWDRTGLLKPSRRVGVGHAARRRYTFRDLLAARALVRLREAKVSTQRIRKAVRQMQSTDVLATARLVVRGIGRKVDVLLVEDAQRLQSLVMSPGQLVSMSLLVVPIGAEAEPLRQRFEVEVQRAA